MHPIKKLIIIGVLIYVGYYMMGHHFIFFGRQVRILKKTDMSMEYTFYSVGANRKDVEYKGVENILAITPLRQAGIGELMVEMEVITEEERSAAEEKVVYGSQ